MLLGFQFVPISRPNERMETGVYRFQFVDEQFTSAVSECFTGSVIGVYDGPVRLDPKY